MAVYRGCGEAVIVACLSHDHEARYRGAQRRHAGFPILQETARLADCKPEPSVTAGAVTTVEMS